jgi:hypothetical protein
MQTPSELAVTSVRVATTATRRGTSTAAYGGKGVTTIVKWCMGVTL